MKQTIWKKQSVVFFGAMLCCMLWGSAFPCVKIGYQLFQIEATDTATQILFAGLRFLFAGFFTILLGSVQQKKIMVPRRRAMIPIVQLCMLQTVVQYLFFYIGLAHTSGVKASIIEGTNVFVALLITSLVLRQERLKAVKVVGSVIGFAGIVIMNLSGGMQQMGMNVGDLCVFLSTIAYAFSSAWMKQVSQKEDPVMLSGYQFFTGGIILAVCGRICGGHLSLTSEKAVAMLCYLALVSAVAYTLWGILLKYNPVSKVAVYGFMNPVCGVFLSAVLLGETEQAFCVKSLLALLLVSAGIWVSVQEKTNA